MSLTKVSYSMINGAPVNVRDFGATGDGSTNDTAAITSAIAFLGNTGTLYFPPGIYLTDPIDIRTAQNITLLGANDATEYPYDIDGMSVIRMRIVGDVAIKTATPNVDSYTNPTTEIATIQNLLVDCLSKVNTGINCARGIRIQGCTVQGAINDGIVLEEGTFPVWIDHVLSRNNGRDGIRVNPSFTTIYNITNTECSYNSGNGFSIYDGSSSIFMNCLSQGNTGNGYSIVYLDPASYAQPIFLERLVFIGCYSEDNTSYGILTNSYNTNPSTFVGKIDSLTFINCAFNSGAGLNAQLRGLSNPNIIGSPFLSAAMDPVYNTIAFNQYIFEGNVKLKSSLQFEQLPLGQWGVGAGSPEGVVSGSIGSLYTRTDGSTSTTLYVKTSGSGNVGWTAK